MNPDVVNLFSGPEAVCYKEVQYCTSRLTFFKLESIQERENYRLYKRVA